MERNEVFLVGDLDVVLILMLLSIFCLSVASSSSPVVEPVGTKEPKTDSKTDPQRKAKNFAERLMHVLQGQIGTDTVWWVGEGKAVAIHTRNLKDGDMLTQHFRVKDYGVFIRNCNRWYVLESYLSESYDDFTT